MNHLKAAIFQAGLWLCTYHAFIVNRPDSMLLLKFYVIVLCLLAPFAMTKVFAAVMVKTPGVRRSALLNNVWLIAVMGLFAMTDSFGYAFAVLFASVCLRIGAVNVAEARKAA